MGLNRYGDAAADFSTARELNPAGARALRDELVNALVRLASRKYYNGDSAGALADFNAAVNVTPQSGQALAGRAAFYNLTGRADLAELDYEESVRLDPSTLTSRSGFWQSVGNHTRSLEDARAALEIKPADINAILFAGQALHALNRTGEAIEHYTRYIEASAGPNARLFSDRGYMNAAAGRTNEAMADYAQAIRIDPRNVLALRNRGIQFYNLRDDASAIRDLSAAIAIDPRQIEALAQRGYAYRRLGDHAASLADFNAALAINPQHRLALQGRGQAQQAIQAANAEAAQREEFAAYQRRRDEEERRARGQLMAGAMAALSGGDAQRVLQAMTPPPPPQNRPALIAPAPASNGAGSTGQCGLEGFSAQFRQLSNSQPLSQRWGARDTFQYSYFLGTRGLEMLEGHRNCMSGADYQANRQALEGMRDKGLTGCRQLSTSEGTCRPVYPG